ncbi:MAG TPA: hypothetical protein V6D47_10780, partial [Oscillatoriaceae cyanobacterium]
MRTIRGDFAGSSPSLLQTKFALPRQASGRPLLERTRLLAQISEAGRARLILLCAPAGYGKTELAAQVAHAEGGAWLSLDQRDNDPVRFVAYFIGALAKVGVVRGVASGQRLRTVDGETLWTGLEATLNEFSAVEEKVTLVLDDYHRIENPQVHQLLRYIVEFTPPTLRLLLASRSSLPIPLARLRATDELLELTADDLRFSRDEVTSYLAMDDERELPPPLVVAAHERTEGWIIALQLLKSLLHGQSDARREVILQEFGGTNRHLAEIMNDEVLAQSGEWRDFLLHTSILSRLTGSLCDAVTGRSNGAAMLRGLEQAGSLLFAIDDERRWYRVHKLLAQLLRSQLSETLDQTQIATLHRRASDWLSGHGFPDEAIEHAMAASDWVRAIDLLRQLGFEATACRDAQKLRRWLEALPLDVRSADPTIAYWYGAVQPSTSQPHPGSDFLDRAEAHWNEGGSGKMLGSVRMRRSWNAIHQGRYEDALNLARSSISLNLKASAEAQAMSLYTRGVAQVRLGRVRDALASMEEAVAIHSLPLITSVEIGHARALSGDLDGAERDILRGLSTGTPADSVRRGHIWLAEIYLARNELDLAEDQLTQATRLGESGAASTDLPSLEIAQAQLLWAKGEPAAALDHLTNSGSPDSGAQRDDV